MSPASTALRMRVELTFSPPSSTGGTTYSSTPASWQRERSRATSPAAPLPKRKSSPQHRRRALQAAKSTCRTKSSACQSRTWAKSKEYKVEMPASSSRRSLSRPVSTALFPEGLAQKVNTAGSKAWPPAPGAQAAWMTAMWPRCKPSKAPKAKEQGAGRCWASSSPTWWMILMAFPPVPKRILQTAAGPPPAPHGPAPGTAPGGPSPGTGPLGARAAAAPNPMRRRFGSAGPGRG